ncbi:MAG: PilZ domain-containing protein, partial [Myxococcota bacterium]
MEANVDRRGPEGSRVPLEGLVELSLMDFEESFQATGVNVSAGGLSMRAPYLPEVGSELSCRFDVGGEPIVARTEVVWADDSGSEAGEFGLRFVDLSTDDALKIHDAIQRAYRPPEPPAPVRKGQGAVVRLRLDGVDTQIAARVLHRDAEGVTLEQELPFLRLLTGLTVGEDGKRGRIQSVDLVVENGAPRLVLDVSYEPEPTAVDLPAPADATLRDYDPPHAFAEVSDDTIDTGRSEPSARKAEGLEPRQEPSARKAEGLEPRQEPSARKAEGLEP